MIPDKNRTIFACFLSGITRRAGKLLSPLSFPRSASGRGAIFVLFRATLFPDAFFPSVWLQSDLPNARRCRVRKTEVYILMRRNRTILPPLPEKVTDGAARFLLCALSCGVRCDGCAPFALGGQTMDQGLVRLVREGKITRDTAMRFAHDESFVRKNAM